MDLALLIRDQFYFNEDFMNIFRGCFYRQILFVCSFAVCHFGSICTWAQTNEELSPVVGASGVQVSDYQKTVTSSQAVNSDNSKQIEIIDNLLTLLNDGDANAKIEAHYLLLHAVEQHNLAGYLLDRLKKGNRVNAQVALVEALAQIGDSQTVRGLLFELQHGEESSKEAVIRAMGKIGGDAVVPELFDLVVGSAKRTTKMEEEAALALGDVGTKKATVALEAVKARLIDKRSGDPGSGLRKIVDWSIEKAQGGFDTPTTDDQVPKGRTANLRYKGMEYHFYRPPFDARKSEKPWMLICVHDKTYNIKSTYESCRELSDKYRVAILVPVFDPIRFRDYDELNCRGLRADTVLIELIDFLGEKASVIAREAYFWGGKEGGSFVQRFAYLHPERVARAAFFTDVFTGLDEEQYFPNGLKPSPFCPGMKFDSSKIAKVNMGYFWFAANSPLAHLTAYPKFVEQFRARSHELETLSNLYYYKEDIYAVHKVSRWLFDSLDRENETEGGKR